MSLPKSFQDKPHERDLNVGESVRLRTNETKRVWFENIYDRPYKMELQITFRYWTLDRNLWVFPRGNSYLDITNPFSDSAPLFTWTSKGNIIERLRYALTGKI